LEICIHLFKNNFPVTAVLRNGRHLRLENPTAIQSIIEIQKLGGYDVEEDAWIIPYPIKSNDKRSVKLYGGMNSGEVVHIYADEVYRKLPVEGKTVVDVGANIGDSSIYFAIRGAENVLGIEPLSRNYEIAKKNIEVNNLSNRISLLLGGCAANSGYVRVEQHNQTIERCILYRHAKEDDSVDSLIPLFTLEKILEKNNLKTGVVLKMDCEGCEYDVILSASKNLLQRFSHIQIEYHYGHKKLKQKLESSGFVVYVTRPRALRRHYMDEFPGNKWMYSGYLYAKNRYISNA
jgi:FkbM family methyltransferase